MMPKYYLCDSLINWLFDKQTNQRPQTIGLETS